MDAAAAWDTLELPWREAFELAWEAYAADTIPVGAVVVDGTGTIVARGRNRIFEDSAPPGELAGTYLAHAEVNALVGLERRGGYEDHTLYTALEPCTMCVGAAVMVPVGAVRFASVDNFGGGAAMPRFNGHLERCALELGGPLPGPFGLLTETLVLEFFLRHEPSARVLREEGTPLLAAAHELAAREAFAAAASGTRLREFLPEMWDVLA